MCTVQREGDHELNKCIIMQACLDASGAMQHFRLCKRKITCFANRSSLAPQLSSISFSLLRSSAFCFSCSSRSLLCSSILEATQTHAIHAALGLADNAVHKSDHAQASYEADALACDALQCLADLFSQLLSAELLLAHCGFGLLNNIFVLLLQRPAQLLELRIDGQ